uniref:Uncharacterized protein n=1 Tax=Sphaerodactylus townsendi TaxID=933632 RepID=A0ACB8G2J2_9SAUR
MEFERGASVDLPGRGSSPPPCLAAGVGGGAPLEPARSFRLASPVAQHPVVPSMLGPHSPSQEASQPSPPPTCLLLPVPSGSLHEGSSNCGRWQARSRPKAREHGPSTEGAARCHTTKEARCKDEAGGVSLCASAMLAIFGPTTGLPAATVAAAFMERVARCQQQQPWGEGHGWLALQLSDLHPWHRFSCGASTWQLSP